MGLTTFMYCLKVMNIFMLFFILFCILIKGNHRMYVHTGNEKYVRNIYNRLTI